MLQKDTSIAKFSFDTDESCFSEVSHTQASHTQGQTNSNALLSLLPKLHNGIGLIDLSTLSPWTTSRARRDTENLQQLPMATRPVTRWQNLQELKKRPLSTWSLCVYVPRTSCTAGSVNTSMPKCKPRSARILVSSLGNLQEEIPDNFKKSACCTKMFR